VGDNGGSTGGIGVLSPDGSVLGNDWGVYYPLPVGVPIVQTMFMCGVVLAAIGVLGLSPRTGGVGWRGALSAVAAGGARLRTIAVSLFTVGVALAVAAFVLAGTANVNDPNMTLQIPAFDSASGNNPIPYTPVCSAGSQAFRVCVHPGYQPYLSWITTALDPVIAQVSGAPGAPTSASEVPAARLPSQFQQGFGVGQVAGGSYEFNLSNVLPVGAQQSMFAGALRRDLLQAIIVGSPGKFINPPAGTSANGPGGQVFQPDAGTPAQQAVMDGLLEAVGTQPYSVSNGDGGNDNGPPPPSPQVIAAAAKFAALSAATRHAWLAANLAALKAGHITLAQLP
jgi:hypothetical protein